MSEALHVRYDGSLVCLIYLKVRPTLLSVVADISKILCRVTRQDIPSVESMLPGLRNGSPIFAVLYNLARRNLFQFIVQLSQRLPQQWQIALTQSSASCNRLRLLIKKRLDGNSFCCSLVEQCRRAKAGNRGSSAGVVGNGKVAPISQHCKVSLAFLKCIVGIEALAHCVSH